MKERWVLSVMPKKYGRDISLVNAKSTNNSGGNLIAKNQ